MAEPSATDHRNRKAARRHDGSKNERSLIANPSGGVLVHFLAADFGMVEDFPGVKHHFGEGRELGAVHAADAHGHKPCGHLVVGYFAARVAGDQKIDFFAGEFTGVTFLADQVDGAHAFGERTGSVTSALGGVNATRDAHAEIGKALQHLLHVGWQVGSLAGDHLPAVGGIDINMHSEELAADVLTIAKEPRRPKTCCNGSVLKDPDFDVGHTERFMLDQGRFNRLNPLVLVDLLAVRKCAGEIITIHTMKESAVA